MVVGQSCDHTYQAWLSVFLQQTAYFKQSTVRPCYNAVVGVHRSPPHYKPVLQLGLNSGVPRPAAFRSCPAAFRQRPVALAGALPFFQNPTQSVDTKSRVYLFAGLVCQSTYQLLFKLRLIDRCIAYRKRP